MTSFHQPRPIESGIGAGNGRGSRFDVLYAEAKASLGYAGNSLRSITVRYREVFHEELARWHHLRDELDSVERRGLERGDAGATDAAATAEAEADREHLAILRAEVGRLTADSGLHQAELSRLELAVRNLENSWLFLERGDSSLVTDPSAPVIAADLQMRIVEAQEAERTRLAQEVHDGPAQALSNAIFQVEYIERVLDHDTRSAHAELRFLRELLRRELGDVRSFISQLRPPVLEELGLDGSILDTIQMMGVLTGAAFETDLAAPADRLGDTAQTTVLRILQEALQNIRKHAGARRVWVATRIDGEEWILEVRDDGRGFDISAVAARGRRNFGLQFMRERAELIGARFEVRSRASGGTVVLLGIPLVKEN